jgi:GNAT superfamily N-acetyltransferase
MEEQFECSLLKPERLNEALNLVREVFLEYEAPDYSEEGIREFMRFIKPKAIAKMLSENAIYIWICERDNRVIGVLGARCDHINLLFVQGDYHRMGIARQLFRMMLLHFNPESVTVNSSPYAVKAYRKLGFVDTNTEQTVNGIRFVPMKRIE